MTDRRDGSLKDEIYHAVLEGILNCEYKPGQVLNEKELVARFGCSKSPVREALVSLCNDNVLRNIPRYGYEIIRLTREDVEEMIQFRYLLEGGMLQLTLDRISPIQLDKLERLDEACAACADVWSHWARNEEFHLQLMAFSRNEFAYHELRRALDRLKRAYAQFYWSRWDASAPPYDTRNHQAILAAVRRRDPAAALEALKNDLKDFGDLSCDIREVYRR